MEKKVVIHSTVKWTKHLGLFIGKFEDYFIEVRWLDKKDYSVWIFKGDKVLYTKNDGIKSHAMGQSLAVGQLSKLINTPNTL